MTEWIKCTIGDVCSTISETYKGNSKKVVLVNTSDVLEGEILNHKKVDNKDLKGQFKKTFEKDDILYSEIRPANKRYGYVDFSDTENYIASTKLMVIRANKEKIRPRFLFAILKSEHIITQLQLLAETRSGTFPQITFGSELAPMEIFLPSLEIQDKVVSVLKAIEDKIIRNRAINDNLQQQAQALFKAWFVDNCDSPNWGIGCFSDYIEAVRSGDWGKELPNGSYTEQVFCIRGADIPDIKNGNKGKMPTRYIQSKNLSSKKLSDGDIIVEISGGSPTQSTGRIAPIHDALINRYNGDMICTNFCKAITPKLHTSAFVYYYWQYLYDKGVLFSYENGTTGIKNLDIMRFIESEQILTPPMSLIEKFDAICRKSFDCIAQNGLESERLTALRDTLLPKLMSGEKIGRAHV